MSPLTTINIPKIKFTRDGSLDGEDIFMFAVITIVISLSALSIALWFINVFDHHIHTVKTVYTTKTVIENGLTSAQNVFIAQCKTNHRVPNRSNFDDYAIPNVEVTPWTCTFANNPNTSG